VTSRSGSFGRLPAAVATPLAMVLTELLQNALSTPSVTRAVISTYGCSDWQDGSKS